MCIPCARRILGITSRSTPAETKAAFHRLSLAVHPDKHPERLSEWHKLNSAWDVVRPKPAVPPRAASAPARCDERADPAAYAREKATEAVEAQLLIEHMLNDEQRAEEVRQAKAAKAADAAVRAAQRAADKEDRAVAKAKAAAKAKAKAAAPRPMPEPDTRTIAQRAFDARVEQICRNIASGQRTQLDDLSSKTRHDDRVQTAWAAGATAVDEPTPQSAEPMPAPSGPPASYGGSSGSGGANPTSPEPPQSAPTPSGPPTVVAGSPKPRMTLTVEMTRAEAKTLAASGFVNGDPVPPKIFRAGMLQRAAAAGVGPMMAECMLDHILAEAPEPAQTSPAPGVPLDVPMEPAEASAGEDVSMPEPMPPAPSVAPDEAPVPPCAWCGSPDHEEGSCSQASFFAAMVEEEDKAREDCTLNYMIRCVNVVVLMFFCL